MTERPSEFQRREIPMLRALRLGNYRSFNDVTVEFGNLTVLIGPNAAGKSNLLDAISFFRNLAEHGIDDAVSMQGGIDYIRNLRLPKTSPVRLGIDLEWPSLERPFYLIRHSPRARGAASQLPPYLRYRNALVSYDIALGAAQRTRDPRVMSESLKIRFELAIIPRERKGLIRDDQVWHRSVLTLTVSGGKLTTNLESTATEVEITPALSPEYDLGRYDSSEVLLHQDSVPFGLQPIQALSKIPRYDIDPTLGKSALPVTGRAELEEDGDNLPAALRAILSHSGDREKFLALVTDALPFVRSVDVASFSDMTRFLQVRETYSSRSVIPGYLMSDGTIDVITFIVALYFQNAFLTMFEEPDRGLHPAMVRKIGAMMVEESEQRQVIATTHSTELINSVRPDSVQCVVRNDEGNSTVFRPSQSPQFQSFLTTMGIGQLNSAGLLSTYLG